MITSILDSTTLLAGIAIASLFVLGICMTYPSSLLRWLQRKRYQYEITFSLYMMTPTEKFIFNSILFLFLSMVTIAASLYLPTHIMKIARRAYYYVAGDAEALSSNVTAKAVMEEGGALLKTAAEKVGAAVTSRILETRGEDMVEEL